jgi:D-sedoheptulose 7-phosphate isomerase
MVEGHGLYMSDNVWQKAVDRIYMDELIMRFPVLQPCISELLRSVEILKLSFKSDGKLLVCGNGGSAADSIHIVGELMKGFVLPRKLTKEERNKIHTQFPESADYFYENLQRALPAISLTNEIGMTTAYANDKAPDLVFAQQVLGHGKRGDVLFAISTSGNSKNIVYAAKIAKVLGLQVVGLTGKSGGALKDLCDCCICAPESETYKIQELHLPIYHAICLELEKHFFESDY